MELEIALYPVVEGLVPHVLPDSSITSLCQQLAHILRLPTRSVEQIKDVLDSFRALAPYSTQNDLRWQKLTNLLLLLLGIDGPEEMIKYITAFQSVLMNSSPVRLSLSKGTEVNMSGLHTHEKLLSPLRPPSLQAESFENLDRFSDRRSMVSSHRGYGFNGASDFASLEALSDPYYFKMVAEQDILKHIPYTLLATTSDLFPLDWNKIKIPNNIPNGDSELLHILFEASLLHQSMRRCIDQYRNGDISPMKKALLTQMEKEIRIYTAFVNGLSSSNKLKSLKAVYFELYDYIVVLRYYHNFTKNFGATPGDSFLSEFEELRSHGDPLVKKLSSEIFSVMLSLYFEYIISWLKIGKLEATHGEFFIEQNLSEETPIPFRINLAKIPRFIPSRVAKEILLIGKTTIFLGKFCKELQWINDTSKKYVRRYKSLDTNEFSGEVFNIIHEHYQEVISYSYQTIVQKFHLKKVIFALNDILLMGKGDLIDTLMKKAHIVLSTPSDSLPSYRLTGYLQEAVQNSSLRNMLNRADANYVINGLDARVLDLGHGSVGWDVFTLDYIVDAPLSVVLNVNSPTGKKEYLRLFNFLWRFKKNDHFYNEQWLKSNRLIKDFKKLTNYRPLVRDIVTKLSKINILGSQLHQFNLKLESYCFKCIIDENFQVFSQKLILPQDSQKHSKTPIVKMKNGLLMYDGLMKPSDAFLYDTTGSIFSCTKQENTFNIDELQEMHNLYLDSMLSHKLIASNPDKNAGYYSGQSYPTSLILLLNHIFEFITYYSSLNDVAHELLIQLNLHNSQQQLNGLLTRFNSVLTNVVSHYKKFQEKAHLFIRDLRSDGDENLISLCRMLQ